MTEITAHHGLLRDTKLHVDDHGGTGRPVVLLHGWPLSGESWKPQLPALRQAGHRAITYDRRGFGRSDKPLTGYGYDTLAEDLHTVLRELDVHDATLVGFSMGGGEVARYLANYGPDRVRSVVFAAAVTPYMMHTPDNPEGPLAPAAAAKMAAGLTADRDRFFDGFITEFFSVGGQLKVTEQQRQEALALTRQAGKIPALECLTAFGNTDFRDNLAEITVPALVLHGDGDATVPFDGSGRRTHAALPGSRLVVLPGAPHGCNVSHPDAFNHALLDFLAD
ncbi:alpha/beta fold hydrolase [Dactylosporangium matsuzakiense]|uniref:Arylesterase n=1 Tax=Dactylosporangium matsuzakiense TaxID=53360 RepID=A0A9W6KKD2_9ACTN|nr:alpha/beta hydrolase [Dactylosporangium matsuzakiense]UWZ48734.1 alpha/beta hydrolase [Dactylosporangium matsuzakiense]GLL03113.1 arylesterase [Dactylosporangium matsuzakiense]